MAHTFTNLLTHIVFGTKERYPFIDQPLARELHPYLGGALKNLGSRVVIVGGIADHVHILAVLPPARSVSEILREIKSNSSRWIHEKWPALGKFAWQTGYGAFGVSESRSSRVQGYIARQEEHHRTVSFQEEFIALLKKHGLRYDDPFMWE